MYLVGDQVVHPMHGAGVIEQIVERNIEDVTEEYYALKLILDDVVLFVPIKNSGEIGLRLVCSKIIADAIICNISQIAKDKEQCWNRRYRENMLRIRSGDINEVEKVVINLMLRNAERGLSTGEKKMLNSAKKILVSELALSLEKMPSEIEEILNSKINTIN